MESEGGIKISVFSDIGIAYNEVGRSLPDETLLRNLLPLAAGRLNPKLKAEELNEEWRRITQSVPKVDSSRMTLGIKTAIFSGLTTVGEVRENFTKLDRLMSPNQADVLREAFKVA